MSANIQKKKELEQGQESRSTQTALSKSTQPQASQPSTYVESDTVRQAKEKLNSLQKPGEFQFSFADNLNNIINQIGNREKFSYDLNGDALYQQYKNQYMTQGQQAMMDTMGQAAALTGGYGNSYAQMAGQQTYQGYLQELNNKVPELYQLALDQYNREGEDLYNQYSLYADRESTEYGRYRDTVSDYNTERGYLTDQYNNERNFDYGQHIDDRNYAYQVARDAVSDDQWNKSFDYQKDRDAVADSQWQATFDEGVRQFDTNVALTEKEMAIQQTQWQAEFDESVKRADQNYELTVKQIEEDIRHNKISESQGQQQIDLAKKELNQRKIEAQQDYEYKMASLDKNKKADPEPTKEDYASWSEAEWYEFFEGIRLDPEQGGQAAAEKTLNEFASNGILPKKYMTTARLGASGKLGH